MCDTRRYGLLDGNALVGRSRYEQNEVAARTRISLAAIKDSFAESKEDRKDLGGFYVHRNRIHVPGQCAQRR